MFSFCSYFSETVIVVDDMEKVSTLPLNKQQIVERFYEIGNEMAIWVCLLSLK